MGKPHYSVTSKRFEYMIFVKEPVISEVTQLNELGQMGWEVVSFSNGVYLLKREHTLG
jgi:hypothetical protein